MWALDLHPTMFNVVANEGMYRLELLEEILQVLKYFSKDKCPSLDGQTVDLFIHFFYLMGQRQNPHQWEGKREEYHGYYQILASMNSQARKVNIAKLSRVYQGGYLLFHFQIHSKQDYTQSLQRSSSLVHEISFWYLLYIYFHFTKTLHLATF